jgi:hypothetical protein
LKTAQSFGFGLRVTQPAWAPFTRTCTCTFLSCFDLVVFAQLPTCPSQPTTHNIIRVLILTAHLAAASSSYLFQAKTPQTWHIISRPKAGDQPPIASTFANPDFNRLAISNNPPRIFATSHSTSIPVDCAGHQPFLPFRRCSSSRFTLHLRYSPAFAEWSSFAKVDSEEYIGVKHGAK